MGEKTSIDIFLEYVPSLKIWYKTVILYLSQFGLFILVMAFYWWISSTFFYGAILGQSIVSILLVFHFIYIANKAEKIRVKYREKYGELAGQKFWYKYQSYTTPIICAAFYFPLLLHTYDFLPSFISLPSHFINNSLFPFFVSLPLGIIIIIIGFLMRRPSGGYDINIDNYLYTIYPEKSRLITGGMYKYIRNPQYVSRGVIAVGFGIIANNISAIIVGFIHFLSYCAIIPAEDRELTRRYGAEFQRYKKQIPAIFPHFTTWKKFVKYIFLRK